MAAELLLVNPRRKRRHGKRRKAHARRTKRVIALARNPRRKRRGGRRTMSALQRKYFGGGKRRRKSSRVLNVAANPRRRRRHSKRSFLRVRRNPSPLSNPMGYASEAIIPAVAGAAGGVLLDYMFNNISALANLSGMTRPIAQLGIAALLGVGVGMVTDKRTGALVAGGAMTITTYNIVNTYLSSMSSGGGQMNRYVKMGRYVRMGGHRRIGKMKGPRRRMGWWSPARTTQGPRLGRYARMGVTNTSRLQA